MCTYIAGHIISVHNTQKTKEKHWTIVKKRKKKVQGKGKATGEKGRWREKKEKCRKRVL